MELNYHNAYDPLVCPELEEENNQKTKTRVENIIAVMQDLAATRPLVVPPLKATLGSGDPNKPKYRIRYTWST
jgi:hypothetical protein